MVHRHHCVEGTGIALHLEENRIAGIGAFSRNPQRLGRANCRANDVQLFAPERAVIAVVRIQPTHTDARFLQAVALERSVDQLDRLHYPRLGEHARHIGQGDVGRHPGSPEVIEHVEFAERSMEIQQLGEPVQLVAVGHAGHVQ
ncbi:hypothetical protein D3C85_1526220 [compost metagenome]